jgi:hypothetical protein
LFFVRQRRYQLPFFHSSLIKKAFLK